MIFGQPRKPMGFGGGFGNFNFKPGKSPFKSLDMSKYMKPQWATSSVHHDAVNVDAANSWLNDHGGENPAGWDETIRTPLAPKFDQQGLFADMAKMQKKAIKKNPALRFAGLGGFGAPQGYGFGGLNAPTAFGRPMYPGYNPFTNPYAPRGGYPFMG
jgi:hypothetical protein